MLIANSNLVPHWATWEHFNELDRRGLMMYGQMTAGSWIYIGSQGIVQGTYETFGEVGRRHFGGNLEGKWILTAGLGGMGAAQPLAATMAGASMLAVECRPDRIERRLATGYLDRRTDSLDEALDIVRHACEAGRAVSVGLLGNAAEVLPELVRRGVRPDVVTDQTSAHDPANGYLPPAGRWNNGTPPVPRIRRASATTQSSRSSSTCARCWRSTTRAFRRSTTATTFAKWPRTAGSNARSTFRVSCLPISGRFSAAASGRFAGWRSRVTRKTFTGQMPR